MDRLLIESVERLIQIEDRLARAARGPWYFDYDDFAMMLGEPWGVFKSDERVPDYNYHYSEFCELTPETAEFMAHSREDIEYLLSEVRRLRALNNELDVLQYHPE